MQFFWLALGAVLALVVFSISPTRLLRRWRRLGRLEQLAPEPFQRVEHVLVIIRSGSTLALAASGRGIPAAEVLFSLELEQRGSRSLLLLLLLAAVFVIRIGLARHFPADREQPVPQPVSADSLLTRERTSEGGHGQGEKTGNPPEFCLDFGNLFLPPFTVRARSEQQQSAGE